MMDALTRLKRSTVWRLAIGFCAVFWVAVVLYFVA